MSILLLSAFSIVSIFYCQHFLCQFFAFSATHGAGAGVCLFALLPVILETTQLNKKEIFNKNVKKL